MSNILSAPEAPPLDARPPGGRGLGRTILLIGWGIFVSTISQTFPGQLGDLPIRDLLQSRVGTVRMATFFAVAMSPWYFKPIAGLFSDAFPLRGTRRKSYMILGALLGGSLWLLLGAVPRTYSAMLAVAVLMNCGLVIVSSSTAGLLVEEGQRAGATGRLTSARLVVMSAAGVLGGVFGGKLADLHVFGLTAAINALALFSLVPVVLIFLREPRTAPASTGVFRRAGSQLKRLFTCGTMWAAAGMLFLINLSPGFNSPLYEHITGDLHFSQRYLGYMQATNAAAGVVAALYYWWACRRINLRLLLILSLGCAALGVLPFHALHTVRAGFIAYATWGFGAIMAQLAALDLATRASPRGVEAMGYALMVSAYNISLNLSDVSGSWLWGKLHHHFGPLVWINAGTTLIVLMVVPFLPRVLVEGREGESVTQR